jgi:hypothetical protein
VQGAAISVLDCSCIFWQEVDQVQRAGLLAKARARNQVTRKADAPTTVSMHSLIGHLPLL